MPSDGREMPDSAAAGQSPQTLRSLCRLWNGSTAKRIAISRRASLLALAALGGRVAVAEDQEVELVGRVAGALQRDQVAGGRRTRGVDQHVVRVDHQRPDLVEVVRLVALLEHDLHRRRGAREAQRLRKGAVDLGRFAGRLPLAVDRREAARVEDATGDESVHGDLLTGEACHVAWEMRTGRKMGRLSRRFRAGDRDIHRPR